MNYCGPHGVPWDEFVGWPKLSRDAAILWQQHQLQLCRGCGTHPDDWDPAVGGHPRAYVATVHTCPGCAAMDRRSDERKPDGGDPLGPGQSVQLRRQVPRGTR